MSGTVRNWVAQPGLFLLAGRLMEIFLPAAGRWQDVGEQEGVAV